MIHNVNDAPKNVLISLSKNPTTGYHRLLSTMCGATSAANARKQGNTHVGGIERTPARCFGDEP